MERSGKRHEQKKCINQFYFPIDAWRVSGEGARNMRRVWISSDPFISFNKIIQLYLVQTFPFIRTGIIISRTSNWPPAMRTNESSIRSFALCVLMKLPWVTTAQVFVCAKNKTAMLKPNGNNRNIIWITRPTYTKRLRQTTNIAESGIMACVVFLSLMPFSHFYSVNMSSGPTPTHTHW